jgi:hypothetical protein
MDVVTMPRRVDPPQQQLEIESRSSAVHDERTVDAFPP